MATAYDQFLDTPGLKDADMGWLPEQSIEELETWAKERILVFTICKGMTGARLGSEATSREKLRNKKVLNKLIHQYSSFGVGLSAKRTPDLVQEFASELPEYTPEELDERGITREAASLDPDGMIPQDAEFLRAKATEVWTHAVKTGAESRAKSLMSCIVGHLQNLERIHVWYNEFLESDE